MTIHSHEEYFRDGDGHRRFLRRWHGEQTARAAVVIVHGMCEHGGRYAPLAEILCGSGLAVVPPTCWGTAGRKVLARMSAALMILWTEDKGCWSRSGPSDRNCRCFSWGTAWAEQSPPGWRCRGPGAAGRADPPRHPGDVRGTTRVSLAAKTGPRGKPALSQSAAGEDRRKIHFPRPGRGGRFPSRPVAVFHRPFFRLRVGGRSAACCRGSPAAGRRAARAAIDPGRQRRRGDRVGRRPQSFTARWCRLRPTRPSAVARTPITTCSTIPVGNSWPGKWLPGSRRGSRRTMPAARRQRPDRGRFAELRSLRRRWCRGWGLGLMRLIVTRHEQGHRHNYRRPEQGEDAEESPAQASCAQLISAGCCSFDWCSVMRFSAKTSSSSAFCGVSNAGNESRFGSCDPPPGVVSQETGKIFTFASLGKPLELRDLADLMEFSDRLGSLWRRLRHYRSRLSAAPAGHRGGGLLVAHTDPAGPLAAADCQSALGRCRGNGHGHSRRLGPGGRRARGALACVAAVDPATRRFLAPACPGPAIVAGHGGFRARAATGNGSYGHGPPGGSGGLRVSLLEAGRK